jgi:LSD1 subclass zinc finger protein
MTQEPTDSMVPEEGAPSGPAPEAAPASPTPETGEPGSHRIKEISCKNCGAPLEYLEGEAVITCIYCGTTTMLAGYDNIVRIDSHFLLSPDVGRDGAVSAVMNWLGKGFFKAGDLTRRARLQEAKGLVLPYWIVNCRGTTYWNGMNKKSKTTGTGDKQRTEEYWEPVSGNFTEEYTWPVYAREDREEYWGIESLQPGKQCVFPDWGKFLLRVGGSKSSPNRDLLAGKEAFSIEKVKQASLADGMVNGQITQERAERQARDSIIEKHRQTANGKATRISDCDTTVDVTGVDLVYLPMWEITYMYGEKGYHVLVDAHKGEVLSGEAPVGKWAKVTVFDVFFGLIAAVFAAVGITGHTSWAVWTAVALGLLVAGYTALTGFRKG